MRQRRSDDQESERDGQGERNDRSIRSRREEAEKKAVDISLLSRQREICDREAGKIRAVEKDATRF